MNTEQREQLAESDFKRSIACLQLEVPGAVWDDVKVKSDALLARLSAVERENETWREASKTWAGVERKLTNNHDALEALTEAARMTSHGDHNYDPDRSTPRMDCILCAAIERRFQPAWMEEPHEWLQSPAVARAALAALPIPATFVADSPERWEKDARRLTKGES